MARLSLLMFVCVVSCQDACQPERPCLAETSSTLRLVAGGAPVHEPYTWGFATGTSGEGTEGRFPLMAGFRGVANCSAASPAVGFWLPRDQLSDGATIPLADTSWWLISGKFNVRPSGLTGDTFENEAFSCAGCTGTLTVHGDVDKDETASFVFQGQVPMYARCGCDTDGNLVLVSQDAVAGVDRTCEGVAIDGGVRSDGGALVCGVLADISGEHTIDTGVRNSPPLVPER